MSQINGVDERAPFFPININRENTVSNPGVENNLEVAGTDPSGNHPDFQTTFKTILDGLTGVGTDSTGTGVTNSLSPLAEMNNNNDNTGLMSVLKQMSNSGLSSQDSDQTEEQSLNQFLGASVQQQVENQNSAQPITAVPTSQVISSYQQAMQEFQKAFNLMPAGNSGETDPNSIHVSNIGNISIGDIGEIANIDDIGNIGNISDSVPSSVEGNSSLEGTPSLKGTTSEVIPQDAVQSGVNPTQQQVINYITEQCRQLGIPAQLGLATAATESGMLQFNKDGTPLQKRNPDSTDWGLMQINDRAWGDVYDLKQIKSDWKYNIQTGLQILKQSFDAALQNNEGGKGVNNSIQNLARAAYSGYNAGTGNVWRYRTPVNEAPKTGSYDVINNEGYDLRDIRFWENYQKFSGNNQRRVLT